MPSKISTRDQISAGGVAFRRATSGVEVALIRVATPGRDEDRWQLPKGLVDADEDPEAAAMREVQEETGVRTTLIAPIDTIEYWYVGHQRGGGRVRFHKQVHFYLLAYADGKMGEHDWEVEEARWVPIAEAIAKLSFKNERAIVEKAREMIAARSDEVAP